MIRPSRTEELVALAQQGMTAAQIGARMGKTVNAVRVRISQARAAGVEIPYEQPRPEVSAREQNAIRDALLPHARARGINTPALVRRLLAVIAGDPALVDAILDDRGGE